MNDVKTRIKIADYSKLAERTGREIKFADKEIALFKLSNGDVRAIENRSPHPKGGTLAAGLVSGKYVYCPVYDWKISLVSGKVQAPDKGKVKTFDLEVDGDSVFIVI